MVITVWEAEAESQAQKGNVEKKYKSLLEDIQLLGYQ